MPEPTTLAAVGVMALAEGVKFLYTEASSALKSWRDKQVAPTAPAEVPPVFAGELAPPLADLAVVEKLEAPLREARRDLADVADGIEPVDAANADLLARIDTLRTLMEGVLQQRITFQGENRPPSGPLVQGSVDVDELKAYAAGIRAKTIRGGAVTGSAKAKTIGEGGQLIGVDVGDIE